MNNFILAGLILISFFFVKIVFQKYRYLSPSLICCIIWGIACFASSIRMHDPSQNFSSAITYYYILPFAMVTVCAFMIASFFNSKKHKFELDIKQLLHIKKKYYFILILCFIFGTIRLVYTLSISGFSSLLNYLWFIVVSFKFSVCVLKGIKLSK